MPALLAQPPVSPPPEHLVLRVVLDTSTLIMGVRSLYSKPWWLRDSWHNRRIIPLTSNETESEFKNTLRKPRLQIPSELIRDIERDYLDYCTKLVVVGPLSRVPRCRDPKDQPFLDLAHYAEADYLVTGDDDLLILSEPSLVPIITPERLRDVLRNPL